MLRYYQMPQLSILWNTYDMLGPKIDMKFSLSIVDQLTDIFYVTVNTSYHNLYLNFDDIQLPRQQKQISLHVLVYIRKSAKSICASLLAIQVGLHNVCGDIWCCITKWYMREVS